MEISCLDQRAQSGQSSGPAQETLARNLVICTRAEDIGLTPSFGTSGVLPVRR